MNKKIFILRHGETDKINKRMILSSNGWKQSNAICNFLSKQDICRIYSIPQERAIASITYTKEYLSIPLIIDNRLKDFAILKNHDILYKEKIENSFFNTNLRIFDGESMRDVILRINSFINDVEKSCNRSFVVSTHGVCASIILSIFSGVSPCDIWKSMKNGSVYSVTL